MAAKRVVGRKVVNSRGTKRGPKQAAMMGPKKVVGKKQGFSDIRARFEKLKRLHYREIAAGTPIMLHPDVIVEALKLIDWVEEGLRPRRPVMDDFDEEEGFDPEPDVEDLDAQDEEDFEENADDDEGENPSENEAPAE